jgi:arylsulfatase A-like enzyme
MQVTAPAEEVTVAKILGGAGYTVHEGDSAGAAGFLDSQTTGKPFYLQVNLSGLRAADVPKKYLDLYAKESFEGYTADRPAANAALGKEKLGDIIGNVRKAAAAISAMDDEVGVVHAKLRQKGLADNTITVFAAASGALLGRHGLWDAAQGSNPPNMFDEAVATPILWSWLGHIPALAHRPELISAYDFVPTLCSLLSIDPPKRNLCGRSYAPLVTGKPLPKKQPWRLVLCAHMENTDMAREERYKLVSRDEGKGPGELYDLAVDPGERTNQFDNQQFLTIHNELADAIAKWKQKYSS